LTKGSLRVNVYLVGFKVKTNFEMKNVFTCCKKKDKGEGEDNIGIIISWLFKFNMFAAMTMYECRENPYV